MIILIRFIRLIRLIGSMNTPIITLLINEQQYHIHEHYLKKCKYFRYMIEGNSDNNYVLDLDCDSYIICIFFEILYGDYDSATNELKNINDVHSLIKLVDRMNFTPKEGFIERLLENYKLDEVYQDSLEVIKNINNDEIRRLFLSKFIHRQLSGIEVIIMEYKNCNNYCPNKQRLIADDERSIEEIIKYCFEFYGISCKNIILEVMIWLNYEDDEFKYEIDLEIDKIIDRKYIDIGHLANAITDLVVKKWK